MCVCETIRCQLARNDIGGVGAAALGHGIARMRAVRTLFLYLTHNDVDVPALLQMCRSLWNAADLHHCLLDVRCNPNLNPLEETQKMVAVVPGRAPTLAVHWLW